MAARGPDQVSGKAVDQENVGDRWSVKSGGEFTQGQEAGSLGEAAHSGKGHISTCSILVFLKGLPGTGSGYNNPVA